ncbi:MAG: 2-C-methyl-D-erythritol 2,4-cyclodiphosphate synthase [Candidatus Omnitrophica bacterium]|nr:2-C-methyl-D-erythritol 2,4-cyclodiphosphate synthase [Candidatus Omnitrophota bacterium]
MYRVGIGYDIHRFAPGRKLFIGGVKVPYFKGLLGHSDADVLLHAVCDALLGAIGAGDIGQHFPNTDIRYKGISSIVLLAKVKRLLDRNSARIINIDTMVVLEAPKLARFKEKMKANMVGVLKIDKDRISIKATTNEGVGLIGKGKAACAYATALIKKSRRDK